jgi:hypothetical protein
LARWLKGVGRGFLLGAVVGLFWGLWSIPRRSRAVAGAG